MRDLSRGECLQLLKFVCSFAWTDLKVQNAERAVVERLVRELDLEAEDSKQVQEWLAVPPRPEDVDPLDIPREHRQLFFDAARHAVEADGRVVPGERDALAIFRELLHA
jgi:uncharacterized tellurite resistance protein B-like protein